MSKLHAATIMLMLLSLGGCVWGEEAGPIIKEAIAVGEKVHLPQVGTEARVFETQILERIKSIKQAYDETVGGVVGDVTKEVACEYLKQLSAAQLPTYQDVAASTEAAVKRRGYTLGDTTLTNQIYNTLSEINIGGVTAVQGLNLACQIK